MGVGGFAAHARAVDAQRRPARASRPFDKDRDGFVLGEGAGIVILEELEFARRGRRDLRRDGRLRHVGRRLSHDRAAEDGDGAYRVMRRRSKAPASRPSRSTTSTRTAPRRRINDPIETLARSSACFGDHAYKLAVSSTKSMTGHLLGAAGGSRPASRRWRSRTRWLPPTINLDTPDEGCDLDYVPNARRAR